MSDRSPQTSMGDRDNACDMTDPRGVVYFLQGGLKSVFSIMGSPTAEPHGKSLLQAVGEEALNNCQT